MVSIPATSTEHRRRLAPAILLAAALAVVPAVVDAHPVTPQVVRELVRIQGQRLTGNDPAPAGARDVTLIVLGQRVPFRASEWRTFSVSDATATPPPERNELTVQGDRKELLAISRARPEQRLTILAERRPGASDLFLLAVDRCPE